MHYGSHKIASVQQNSLSTCNVIILHTDFCRISQPCYPLAKYSSFNFTAFQLDSSDVTLKESSGSDPSVQSPLHPASVQRHRPLEKLVSENESSFGVTVGSRSA